jgi:hypothetical protein
MGRIRIIRVWAVSAIALAACSSSSGSSSVSADQASADVARALCSRYSACSPFFVQFAYGTVDACTAGAKTTIASALDAKGTGDTPAQIEACAGAIPAVSCDDAVGHNLPAACQPVAGQLASGAACGDSSQCQSAYCHKGPNSACGACASQPTAGASCSVDGDCAAGDVCSKAGTCAAAGASGAACEPTQRPCKPTLACKSGTCATPDEAGAPCTKTTTAGMTTSDTCDALAGLYCGAQGTCVAIELAAAGQPCLLVNGGLTVCSANGVCNVPSMPGTTGACLSAAAPGATCTPKPSGQAFGYSLQSPDCAPPATCENSVCTIPDPASCH